MMIRPGITELSRYVDSRYTLVAMAAKRARMISDAQNHAEVYDANAEKAVTIAVTEISQGRVSYVRGESLQKAKQWEEEKAEAIHEYTDASEDADTTEEQPEE